MIQNIQQNLEYFQQNGNSLLPYSMLIDSGHPGPHIVFMGSIHGHEPAGTESAIRLHKILTRQPEILARGRVTFILGNPQAYAQNKRFLQSNLNRAFKDTIENDLEGQRAGQIRDYLSQVQADFLMDFHSVSVGEFKIVFYHNATPASLDIAERISDIPIFCEISESIVPNSLLREAARYNIKGISVECGNNDSLTSIDTAFNHSMALLADFQMLASPSISTMANFHTNKFKSQPEKIEIYHMLDFIKPDYGFRFIDSNVTTGTEVKKGQIYAVSDNGPYIADQDYVILIPDKNPHPGDHDAGFLCKREILPKPKEMLRAAVY
jgi:succinylglutamate desuccinylase